jgi:DNA repair photolyase
MAVERKDYRSLFSQKVSKKKRMFPFISDTCNPIGGYCYDCGYCYIHGGKGMKKRYGQIRDKYTGNHELYDSVLSKKFKKGKFVFQSDCIDIFHPDIPSWMVRRVLEWIGQNDATFLILTKNPKGFLDYVYDLPDNIAIGITCESNRTYSLKPLMSQFERLRVFKEISYNDKMKYYPRLISVEPIMRFDMITFFNHISFCKPDCVAVGYDSNYSKLNEPFKAKTLQLIYNLRKSGILVIEKLIREKWNFDNKQFEMRDFT